jgi:crotonobetainyl-CoA:carnitine CoA-transferase CaiB-like acyl-CoA transferase
MTVGGLRAASSDALAGITVLDLTRNFAGPYCSMLMADLGAQVIKVESPTVGDDTRQWSPPEWNGVSATFLAANRGKRSVAVDLDSVEGQDVVRRLGAKADVVISSFRPGSLAKRGLDDESLRLENSRLIYCSISAYGSRGPKRDWPGYDPILQAESGMMALTGYPDGPPARLPIAAIDLGTAMWASVGIQAALRTRDETGEGGLVEVSLYETAAWWLSYLIAGYLGSGEEPERHGSGAPFLAPYELFATADGDLMVTAANDDLFARLCHALGFEDLPTDPSYRQNADRVANRAALHDLLQARFLERSAAEWHGLLRSRSVPCTPVRAVADFVEDEQLAALGMLVPLPHPDVPDLRVVGSPLNLDGVRPSSDRPPPRLGEHTEEVLVELGYSEEEIEALVRRHAVGGENPSSR